MNGLGPYWFDKLFSENIHTNNPSRSDHMKETEMSNVGENPIQSVREITH